MRITRYLTVGDYVLIGALIVAATVLSFVLPHAVISGGSTVVVRSGDRVYGRYALDEDREVVVKGPLGNTVVKIEGGRAHVGSSPCPHGLCTRMGEVGGEGGVIVCIPNEVTVTVGAERKDGLDAVSR